MQKSHLIPAGSDTAIEVEAAWERLPDGETGFRVTVEGAALEGSVRLGGDGAGALRIGERVVPFYADLRGDTLQLWLEGEVYELTLREPDRAGRPATAALTAGGGVLAPMPGTVLKVAVRTGDEVAAGAPLVIIESMKMELTVPAPVRGTVAEVRCEPGQGVDLGAVLVRILPAGAEPRPGDAKTR